MSSASISAPTLGKPGATVADKAVARVKDMAGEMEATFLSMLLKEMRQTLDEGEGGGLFPGDTGDVQGGLFDLYLGRHLAGAGGIGLASALVRQMQETGAAPKPVTHTDAHALSAVGSGRAVSAPPGG
ncbi:rod-binding protein [Gemmata sp. JC717]|uniref:Rod-binding protein n=1 Tax=Gemmata algarum TaxID=2975278 RepID=A0ABU5ESF5_9BACT|nr:rod-binding protein [Gemmata algarum]MDY3556837.1 rod-binding protein [Gemmata algarum]MDY3557873.1 rod-binding protein [Gemmata algarum]